MDIDANLNLYIESNVLFNTNLLLKIANYIPEPSTVPTGQMTTKYLH